MTELAGREAIRTSDNLRARRKQQLAIAVARLNARTQLVLALYYQEQCTQAEVSVILGMTEARVERLLRVVTKRLRGELDK